MLKLRCEKITRLGIRHTQYTVLVYISRKSHSEELCKISLGVFKFQIEATINLGKSLKNNREEY